MAYYNYNNVRLKVDNQDILVDSASFSVSAQTESSSNIEQAGGYDQRAKENILTSVNLSYYLTGKDPFYSFTNTTSDYLHSVDIGGMELVSGYVTSYGFTIEPNGLVKIDAALDFHQDVTGSFSPESKPDTATSYLQYKDAKVTLEGIDISSKVLSLGYDVSNDIQILSRIPASGVSNRSPLEINYGQKRTSVSMETYNVFEAIPLEGKKASVAISFGDMHFNISGNLNSKNVSMNLGERLTASMSINQEGYGKVSKKMTDPNYLMHKGGPYLWQGGHQESTWGRATIRPGDTVKMWGYNILDWSATNNYNLDGTRVFVDDVRVNKIKVIVGSSERQDAWQWIQFVWPRFTNGSGNSKVKVTTPHSESNFLTAVITDPLDIP